MSKSKRTPVRSRYVSVRTLRRAVDTAVAEAKKEAAAAVETQREECRAAKETERARNRTGCNVFRYWLQLHVLAPRPAEAVLQLLARMVEEIRTAPGSGRGAA